MAAMNGSSINVRTLFFLKLTSLPQAAAKTAREHHRQASTLEGSIPSVEDRDLSPD
jgi:hypothetical protein